MQIAIVPERKQRKDERQKETGIWGKWFSVGLVETCQTCSSFLLPRVLMPQPYTTLPEWRTKEGNPNHAGRSRRQEKPAVGIVAGEIDGTEHICWWQTVKREINEIESLSYFPSQRWESIWIWGSQEKWWICRCCVQVLFKWVLFLFYLSTAWTRIKNASADVTYLFWFVLPLIYSCSSAHDLRQMIFSNLIQWIYFWFDILKFTLPFSYQAQNNFVSPLKWLL